MDIEHDTLWVLSKTHPSFREVYDKTFLISLPEPLQKRLKEGSLSLIDLKELLKDSNSPESQIMARAVFEAYVNEQIQLGQLQLLNMQALLDESETVQKIPAIEWEEANKPFLPDPHELKKENKDLFEQLKKELARLRELEEQHQEIKLKIQEKEIEFSNEFNEDFPNSPYKMSQEKFAKMSDNQEKVQKNAPIAQKMYEKSVKNYMEYLPPGVPPPPPPPPPNDLKFKAAQANKTSINSQITFFADFTEKDEQANLKPSEIRRMEKEKGLSSGKTVYQKFMGLNQDISYLDLKKQEKDAAAAVAVQREVVNQTAMKLNNSNKNTRVVNDPQSLNGKDAKQNKENFNIFKKLFSRNKKPDEAKKAVIEGTKDKINKSGTSLFGQIPKFVKKIFSSNSNKEKGMDANKTQKSSPRPS